MNAQEPYPFGTILSIRPGDRHELLTAVVYQSDPPKSGDGYRYQCLFPVDGYAFRIAKVYSYEVDSVTGIDTDGDLLCRGCAEATRSRCSERGITPATCA